MTSQTDSLIFLPTILLFLIASTTLINHTQSQTQEQSSNYDLCPPFNCSNITFSFPFSPFSSFGSAQFDCGLPGFQITCDHSSSIPSSIEFSGRLYQVKQLFLSDRLVTVVDHTLMNEIKLGSCTSLENLTNSISNGTVGGGAALELPVGGVNLTVFKCPNALPSRFFNEVVGNYSCKDGNYWAYIWGGTGPRRPVGPLEMPIGCEHVSLPVSGASLPLLASNNITNGSGDGSHMLLAQVLSNGFQLGWPNITDCDDCQMRGGRCGYDGSSRRIVCFCQGGCIKHCPYSTVSFPCYPTTIAIPTLVSRYCLSSPLQLPSIVTIDPPFVTVIAPIPCELHLTKERYIYIYISRVSANR